MSPPTSNASTEPRSMSYTPIPCEFHDRLLHFATRREPVTITYRPIEGIQEGHPSEGVANQYNQSIPSEGAAEQSTEGIIQDVFTKSGAEYLLLNRGLQLRLDQIIRVQDFWLQNAPTC